MVRLRKCPEVKRILNKDWTIDKAGKGKGAKSIFDDLLCEDSSSSEEEKAPKEQITVDESFVLAESLEKVLAFGETPLAMLLMIEWE